MNVNSPHRLIHRLQQLGFEHVRGKGPGVLDRIVADHGLTYKLVALVSRKDACLKVYPEGETPLTFRFDQDYSKAAKFIAAYTSNS